MLVFSLARWCWQLPTGFLRPRGTQDTVWIKFLRLQGFHLLWRRFPTVFIFKSFSVMTVLQPRTCRNSCGLGSSPFARRYLGNHYCFLFLLVLRCFSSQS